MPNTRTDTTSQIQTVLSDGHETMQVPLEDSFSEFEGLHTNGRTPPLQMGQSQQVDVWPGEALTHETPNLICNIWSCKFLRHDIVAQGTCNCIMHWCIYGQQGQHPPQHPRMTGPTKARAPLRFSEYKRSCIVKRGSTKPGIFGIIQSS